MHTNNRADQSGINYLNESGDLAEEGRREREGRCGVNKQAKESLNDREEMIRVGSGEHAAEAGDRDEMSGAESEIINSDSIVREENEDNRSGIRIEEDMSRERGDNEWGDGVGEETDQDEDWWL